MAYDPNWLTKARMKHHNRAMNALTHVSWDGRTTLRGKGIKSGTRVESHPVLVATCEPTCAECRRINKTKNSYGQNAA